MADAQSPRQYPQLLSRQSIIFAVLLVLPGLVPALFGWTSGLLAIPVFWLLRQNGHRKGIFILRNGILLAAVAAIPLKLISSLLFALTLAPMGFSFSTSCDRGENEIQTGVKGFVVLSASWLLFWGGYGLSQGINPYQQLLVLLDTGFAQTYGYYAANAELPAETLLQLEETVRVLREAVPILLPGLLACMTVMTVWVNLLCCRAILARMQQGNPWKEFSQWRLPDRLVWFLIAAGILLLAGVDTFRQASLSVVIVAALLYFMQGLAVFIHFLQKWNIPVYMRIFFYVILLVQSFGFVILTLVGLADVWFNFRQRHPVSSQNGG